ncbi:hypothetical protein [Ciceribacter sp. L1K22]|uniref:hypothetical protein n=1 Tax=Ciceribacter sp. L1K22 TaxID=2820275 RepID=UPI001ABED5A5|nr:hypothetical protein [Ciceribacter sp. L1K22]MBO3759289.1 hypothetical protein [Ciceribacter sp. L1K22]
MKRIEAAEQGFSQANAYYLLMWVLTAIVALTSFFEYRAIGKERRDAEAIIERHDPLLRPAEDVAVALRSALFVADTDTATEAEALRLLRARHIAARDLLTRISANVAKLPLTDVENRVAVNNALNWLLAMQYYNAVDAQHGPAPFQSDEKSLQTAEFPFGTLLVADSVEGLRMEDAARLLWIAREPQAELLSRSAELVTLSEAAEGQVALLDIIRPLADRGRAARERDLAHALWVAWLQSGDWKSGPDAYLRELAHRDLKLGEPQAQTVDAYRRLVAINAKASGEKTSLKLPVVDVPVALSDAVVVLPLALCFCLVVILIYTERGMRYAREAKRAAEEVVGSVPVFYTGYGIHPLLGQVVSTFLLALPSLLAASLSLIAPDMTRSTAALWLYWSGLGLAAVLTLIAIRQTRHVFRLMDENIVVKAK